MQIIVENHDQVRLIVRDQESLVLDEMPTAVFDNADAVQCVASRLSDADKIRRSRKFPYQFFAAYLNAAEDVPRAIKTALHQAAEIACGNVPEMPGPVVIGLDTSGSMQSPVTGQRGRGGSTSMRCVDVAALFAAAMLRRNPDSVVIPFDTSAYDAQFEHLELKSEQVADFDYQPTACRRPYRMVVIRKNISHEKGEKVLFDEIRYFFYITNDRDASAAEIVFGCNDRCDQENLIANIAGGARALSAPVDSLVSNWAYMVMTSLAWTLKAWSALLLPVVPRHRESHEAARTTWLRMEFKTFVNEVLKVPCQIVRQGHRVIHRVLHWNPQLPTLFRLAAALNC